MRLRAREFLTDLSWKDAMLGALVGLVLSAAIQPFALAFFTDLWVEVGAPGHTPPPVEAGMSKMETGHVPGEKADGYGNLTWKEGYEEYRVVIKNNGSNPAYDLETRVPFPGCIVGIAENNPFSEEDYGLTNQLETDIDGAVPESKYRCSRIINTDRLFPGEQIVVDFVIRDQFDQCDVLLGYHDGPELITQYRWQKANQIYTKVVFDSERNLTSEFKQFRRDNPGVMIEQATPMIASTAFWFLPISRKCGNPGMPLPTASSGSPVNEVILTTAQLRSFPRRDTMLPTLAALPVPVALDPSACRNSSAGRLSPSQRALSQPGCPGLGTTARDGSHPHSSLPSRP